jgi:hypothetical protein
MGSPPRISLVRNDSICDEIASRSNLARLSKQEVKY